MIRVLIAEQHPVMRAGLESLLRAEPGFLCVVSRPDVVLATRGPIVAGEDAAAVIDPADDVPALLDRLRLAARAVA